MNRAFILIVLFVNFSIAQDISFKIEKSKLFEDEYKDSEIVLAEKTENEEFIIIRSFESKISTKSGFYIETYNKSLKITNDFEFEIERPIHEKYKVVLGAFYTNSSVNIVEIFYDLKSKNYVCINNKIDKNFVVEKIELFSLGKNEVKGFGIQSLFKSVDKLNLNKDNSGLFKLEEDVDFIPFSFSGKSSITDKNGRSELLLKINEEKSFFSIALSFTDKNTDFVKVFLFDKNCKKLIEHNFSKKEGESIYKNIEIDNKEPILFLSQKVFSKDSEKEKNRGKYFYIISKISPLGIQQKKLEIDEFYLPSLTIHSINEKLIALGFYSKEKDFRYSGISFFELDNKTLEIKTKKFNSFSDQFIIDKYGEIKDKEFKNIVVKSISINKSDEICLNAEENYAKTYSVGGPYYNTNYHYDDIISLRFNNKGEMLVARNINKSQYSKDLEDSSFYSFTSFSFNEDTYFFINTKDEVRKISNDRIEFKDVNKNNSNLFVVQVQSNGDFHYKEVLNKDDNEVPFMVSKGIVIDNSIIFLGRKGKDKQLLKVTLN